LLRIGYLMQNVIVDLDELSGPQLHIKAVFHGLQHRRHQVRMVANQHRQLVWSDNLQSWQAVSYGFSLSKWFRLIESILRRLQSELKLPYIDLFESLRFADSVRQHLQGFDLLYERHGYMGYGGIIASRWLRIPIVIELNGNIIQEIDESGVRMSVLQRRIGKWITHQTWRAASHLIVVSEALKLQLLKLGIPEDKISVIQNGVDVSVFTRHYDSLLTRDKYGLGTQPVIAFVGSFQPWHGVDLLVNSFNRLRSEHPGPKLVLIGHGEGFDAIRQMVDQLELTKEIIFTGRLEQEQVASILNAADILVAPYPFAHSEIVGTPLKLLEYMAVGKAILASSAPIHEVIEDGFSGLRVAPADVGALAEGLRNLLADHELRDRLGKNARMKAIQCYSWDRAVDKVEIICQKQVHDRGEDKAPNSRSYR
jgi:glycosyltransferase involved in cell wall biosynthesis